MILAPIKIQRVVIPDYSPAKVRAIPMRHNQCQVASQLSR
jgi:hypothetical protein